MNLFFCFLTSLYNRIGKILNVVIKYQKKLFSLLIFSFFFKQFFRDDVKNANYLNEINGLLTDLVSTHALKRILVI